MSTPCRPPVYARYPLRPPKDGRISHVLLRPNLKKRSSNAIASMFGRLDDVEMKIEVSRLPWQRRTSANALSRVEMEIGSYPVVDTD